MKHKLLAILLTVTMVAELAFLPESAAITSYAAETETVQETGDEEGDAPENSEGVEDEAKTGDEKPDSEEGSDENGTESEGDTETSEDGNTDDENVSEDGELTENEENTDEENAEADETEAEESDLESEDDPEAVSEEDDKVALAEENIFKVIKCDGKKITVYAEAGVFPEGTEVSVKKVDTERTFEIEKEVLNTIPSGFGVDKIIVYDITFSLEGKEIQPEEGSVAVAISLDSALEEMADNENAELKVFHIADGDTPEEKSIVDPSTIIPEYEETSDETVGFMAEEFSEYAVAVITDISKMEGMCGAVAGNDAEVINATVSEVIDCDSDDYVFAASLPSSYQTANLPGLRNQNPYGTCWAHASMAMAEIYEKNHGGDSNLNLSELHTAYFLFNDVTDPIGGTAGDHNQYTGQNILNQGSNYTDAALSLATWKGAASESLAPYSNSSAASVRDMTDGINSSYAYNDERHITDMYILDIKNNQDIVKTFIRDYGSVGIMYYANFDGAYNSTYNSYYCPPGYIDNNPVNHAVTLVGWDDSFPASNFNTAPAGNGAWLVRNSWVSVGPQSSYYNSEYGYFWLSYYDNSIYPEAYYMKYASSDNFDNNYQYDGNICNGSASALRFANVFTASQGTYGEDIKAVSIFANDSEVNYTIQIYKDLTGADPSTGILAATKTGRLTYAGYHTINLDSPVVVDNGEKYAVVVSLKLSNGNNGHIGSEYNWGNSTRTTTDVYNKPFTGTLNQTCSASAGQSFCYDGASWVDFGKKKSANLRIKAFTDNRNYQHQEVVPQDVIFTDSTLATSGKTINVGETFTPTYRIEPQNADNKNVNWSSSNPSVATVASDGTITGQATGQSTITATTVVGNKKASFVLTVVGLKISSSLSEMAFGKEYRFAATGYASGATVSWKSSNTAVLTVDSTGLVKAKEVGTAQITATAGGYSTSCTVSVIPNKPSSVSWINGDTWAVNITWKPVAEAEYYRVQKPDGSFSDNIMAEDTLGYTHNNYSSEDSGKKVDYYIYTYRKGISSSLKIGVTVSAPTSKIVYHVGNGTNNPLNPTWYKSGNLLRLYEPTAPTGYTFDGWYKDASYSSVMSSNNTYTGSGELNLYAKYKAGTISYTLKLNNNDGTGGYSTVPLTGGATYKLPTPTRSGYEFVEWNTRSDGCGTSYYGNQTVSNLTGTNGATVNLYAQWRQVNVVKQYSITYVLNGGINNSANPSRYTEGTTVTLKNPSRAGYTFGGWYESFGCTGPKTEMIDSSRTGNIVLYAKWNLAGYTITLANMSGGGINTPYPGNIITYTKNSAITLKKPTRVGYTFGGWYSDSRLKKKITKIKKGTIGDRTIYAKWTANKYKVKFNKNGGKGSTKTMTVTYDRPFSLRANKFSRKGYRFIGWAKSKNGSVVYSNGQSELKNLTTKKNGSVTLYAIWQPEKYTIAYRNIGEENPELTCLNNNPDEYFVTTPTIKLSAPVMEGRTFVGWYSDPQFKKKVTSIKKGTVGNKVLYAKWK